MSVFRKQNRTLLVMASLLAIGIAFLQPAFALTPDQTAGITSSLLGDGTATTVAETVKNIMAAAITGKYAALSGAELETALANEMADIFAAYVAANKDLVPPMNMKQLATLISAGASFAIATGAPGVNLENVITAFLGIGAVGLSPEDAVQFQAGVANGRTIGQRVAARANELGIDPVLQDLFGTNAAGQIVASIGFVGPDGQVEAYGTEAGAAVRVTPAAAGKIGENNSAPSPT